MMSSETVVVAMFDRPEDARSAYRSLRNRGVPEENLNLVMSDKTRAAHFVSDVPNVENTKQPPPPAQGQGVNGTATAALGTAVGAGIGTAILPGLGTIAGAATGGSIGAFFGLIGVDGTDQRTIASGGVMLGVKFHPNSQGKEEIIKELRDRGAKQITTPENN